MKYLVLAALAVTLALYLLREPPPAPKSAAAPKQAPPPVPQAAPPAKTPTPVAKSAPAKKPAAAPRSEPKAIAAPPPAPEPASVAEEPAAPPAPPQAAKPAQDAPNSVFGWGPWSANPTDASAGADLGASRDDSVARAQGLGPVPGASVVPPPQFAANAPGINTTGSPPGGSPSAPAGTSAPSPGNVVPPPLSIKPGHGWGDRNHTHRHRRDR